MAKSMAEERKNRSASWLTLALVLLVGAIPVLIYGVSTGPEPERTGGFGEQTCAAAGCHASGPTSVNTGPGSVEIIMPSEYSSAQTVPVTVRVSDPDSSQQRWGFELAARTNPGGAQAGNLIIGSDGFTQLRPSTNGIQYISHTLAGTRPGTPLGVDFTFQWQAPDVSFGPVIFHVAANAANGNFAHDPGDRIYTSSKIIQPQQVSGLPPNVFDGGTVSAASFEFHPAPVSAGSIVAIFGADLTLDGMSSGTYFDSNGRLATSLAGASVTMKGTNTNEMTAPLFAAYPGQVNAQVPVELAGETSAEVRVTVGGQTSVPRTVFLNSVAPGIFTTNAQGFGQGAILNASDASVAAPVGSIPGRTTRPAVPGVDYLVIYFTGGGQVEPPIETGAPAPLTTLHNTLQMPTVVIDGVGVTPNFSGLTPTLVGLYQANVLVPASTRTGSAIPVYVLLVGKQSNTVTIAVGQEEYVPPPDDYAY